MYTTSCYFTPFTHTFSPPLSSPSSLSLSKGNTGIIIQYKMGPFISCDSWTVSLAVYLIDSPHLITMPTY